MQIIALFEKHVTFTKIRTLENLFLTRVSKLNVNECETLEMVIYWFFKKPVPKVSSPYHSWLFSSLPPATIKVAHMAVRQGHSADVSQTQAASKPRRTYAKFTPEDQAAIAKYVMLHGNKASIHNFSKEMA